MSNITDQSSRQPSLSGQLDASPSNSVNNENCKQICRDFIWGLCKRGPQCNHRHELDFEAMKKTLKFCHDFQNPSGCTREHCSYLHTSKEEQSLFFATGTLPRVLAERHANITGSSAETIRQIALFIQESLVGDPPPPPPATSAIAPTSTLTPRPTMPLQQLPPPPPPPPQPNTSTATTVQPTPLFAVPPPQPPPSLPMFDASRPPPSIPPLVLPKTVVPKRQAHSDPSSAPCKIRITDELKSNDSHCDKCVQRQIRIESYRQQMEKIRMEDEFQTLIYKKKLMKYQKQKELLRKLIDSDMFKIVEESLEDAPQCSIRDPLSSLIPSFLAGMSSTSSKQNHQQFLLQFMEYMFSNTRSFETSSVHVEESLRTLTTTPRRSHQSPDILQTLKDILGQNTSSERSVSSDLNADSGQSAGPNGVSGYRRYSNGRVETRAPPPPVPPTTLSAPAPPLPASVASLAPSTAYPPSPVYPPYPPPRPYYPPPFVPANRAPAPRPPAPPGIPDATAPPYYHYQ